MGLILIKDLGMKFPNSNSKSKRRYGLYKCHLCNKEFQAITTDVKSGNTSSCGCIKLKHGLRHHRLYKTWWSMINRCQNQKHKQYKDYGGRGILVCDRWLNIENFIQDMFPTFQEGLTLDKKDNDKGYLPSNCRWSLKTTQSQNTRKIRHNNTSGFKGVSFDKVANKWKCRIQVNNKSVFLGYFITSLEAAKTYDKYILNNNLEHTRNTYG